MQVEEDLRFRVLAQEYLAIVFSGMPCVGLYHWN